MAADMPNHIQRDPGNSTSLSRSGTDDAELRGCWAALLEGGSVTHPLDVALRRDAFGMPVDRFGVAWMANITAVPPEA